MEMHSLYHSDDHSIYFRLVVESLILKFRPLQIFCFSKQTVLEKVQSCFNDRETKAQCNYCLLLVTRNTNSTDYEVQDYSNEHFKLGTVTILCHAKETIKQAFKANNRFFIRVCAEAEVLYNHDDLSDFYVPNHFIPTQFGIKALKYFNYHIPLSERFLIDAQECLSKEQYTVCGFMLHQVVKQVCIGLIRVFMDYRSEIHSLYKLLRLCGTFSDAPVKLFLSGSPEDERLFDILLKSYSSARHKSSFVVLTDDAWALYNKTSAFVALAKDLCIGRITQLEQAAECYREYASQLSIN